MAERSDYADEHRPRCLRNPNMLFLMNKERSDVSGNKERGGVSAIIISFCFYIYL